MAAFIPISLTLAVSWAAASGTSGCEQFWSAGKDLPQHKYIARPVYKFVASHSNAVIATAASFL